MLVSVLSEAEMHIPDVSPILLHPRQLQVASDGFLYPGVEETHYEREPWTALLEAADRAGVTICEIGDRAMCVVDESRARAGFIALGEVTRNGDSASVHVAATELGGEWGYAVTYYKVRLARMGDGWAIESFQEVGSAN